MTIDEMAAKAFRVSSFTSVGHLLHINLKDHLLESKHEIGAALLDKVPRALAVVNKINSIENTYRNFDIEVIAKRPGVEKTNEELMIVEVNENKCRFKFDFSKVYWNSRLSTEHERIINKLNKGIDIVIDLFAGVGPFAVPAAKAKCKTYANDLNPNAVEWLKLNMTRNKVQPDMVRISNKDARDFILDDLRPILLDEYKKVDDEELATMPKIHILMNLPALAPTFLTNFIGLFGLDVDKNTSINEKPLLELFRNQNLDHIVYCYCFLKGIYEDPKAEVRAMIEENLGRHLEDDQLLDIFRVRNVSVYKDMYRVEIRLDENILFGNKSVSIMKNGRTPSSWPNKRVTINDSAKKRSHDDSDTSDDSENCKRSKVTDYCSVM